ncbi:hypothetical protein DXG01_013001 [Tephrocybe rancida]|nr:hypothetical protein DXG01_013001 [Tephrocybe rancida]
MPLVPTAIPASLGTPPSALTTSPAILTVAVEEAEMGSDVGAGALGEKFQDESIVAGSDTIGIGLVGTVNLAVGSSSSSSALYFSDMDADGGVGKYLANKAGVKPTLMAKGDLTVMGRAAKNGMVLVLSVWDDRAVNMFWLDSTYTTTASTSTLGAARGTCATTSGTPADVEANPPNSSVAYSDIRFGDIDSTYSGTTGSSSAPSSSATTPRPVTSLLSLPLPAHLLPLLLNPNGSMVHLSFFSLQFLWLMFLFSSVAESATLVPPFTLLALLALTMASITTSVSRYQTQGTSRILGCVFVIVNKFLD